MVASLLSACRLSRVRALATMLSRAGGHVLVGLGSCLSGSRLELGEETGNVDVGVPHFKSG